MRLEALTGFCLALGFGADANSVLDYHGYSDASVALAEDTFRIYVNKNWNTFLIQPAMSVVVRGGGHFPITTWRIVAEKFVYPVGCGISDLRALSKMGASWEATYVCPASVDLLALVNAQRADLRRGVPLHGGISPPVPVPAPAVAQGRPVPNPTSAASQGDHPPAKSPRSCIKVLTDPSQNQC